jgi:hypothetical protein
MTAAPRLHAAGRPLESREKNKEMHSSFRDEDVNGDTREIMSVEEKSFDMLHARPC